MADDPTADRDRDRNAGHPDDDDTGTSGTSGTRSALAAGGWKCPLCGADYASEQWQAETSVGSGAGKRLKIGIAVAFVLVWLGTEIYDWFDDPATVLLPGWFSALGIILLFYLIGLDPVGLLRRRS